MSSKYWDLAMNFIGGCSPCSVGCAHCWAADCASKRLANHPLYEGLTKNGKWTGEIRIMPELIKVIGGGPKTIFWCNMSDMFHEKVRFEDIDKAFAAMALMPQHKHLVLTKRIKRVVEYHRGERWRKVALRMLADFANHPGYEKIKELARRMTPNECRKGDIDVGELPRNWPLPNVHLGATICTQKEADKIIPILLQIPAAVRFISFEPLLEYIDCEKTLKQHVLGELFGGRLDENRQRFMPADWLIYGCESGPNRRLCELDWIRKMIKPAQKVGIPVFVKQVPINGKVSHDPAEWPEGLRIREMP